MMCTVLWWNFYYDYWKRFYWVYIHDDGVDFHLFHDQHFFTLHLVFLRAMNGFNNNKNTQVFCRSFIFVTSGDPGVHAVDFLYNVLFLVYLFRRLSNFLCASPINWNKWIEKMSRVLLLIYILLLTQPWVWNASLPSVIMKFYQFGL